jgi:hypothetical protein
MEKRVMIGRQNGYPNLKLTTSQKPVWHAMPESDTLIC